METAKLFVLTAKMLKSLTFCISASEKKCLKKLFANTLQIYNHLTLNAFTSSPFSRYSLFPIP